MTHKHTAAWIHWLNEMLHTFLADLRHRFLWFNRNHLKTTVWHCCDAWTCYIETPAVTKSHIFFDFFSFLFNPTKLNQTMNTLVRKSHFFLVVCCNIWEGKRKGNSNNLDTRWAKPIVWENAEKGTWNTCRSKGFSIFFFFSFASKNRRIFCKLLFFFCFHFILNFCVMRWARVLRDLLAKHSTLNWKMLIRLCDFPFFS